MVDNQEKFRLSISRIRLMLRTRCDEPTGSEITLEELLDGGWMGTGLDGGGCWQRSTCVLGRAYAAKVLSRELQFLFLFHYLQKLRGM